MKNINNLLDDIFQNDMWYDHFKIRKNEKTWLINNIIKYHLKIMLQTITYHTFNITM